LVLELQQEKSVMGPENRFVMD